MPAGFCRGCKRITNSVTSNWWDLKNFGKPTMCWGAYVKGQWVKGCAYDKASDVSRVIVDKLIRLNKKKEKK